MILVGENLPRFGIRDPNALLVIFASDIRDLQGNRTFQTLSLLEPILPASQSIERNYSPLWALWRFEKDGTTGATGQSLLWVLCRRQTTGEAKQSSFLFGLVKHQTTPKDNRWRWVSFPKQQPGQPSAPP